MQTGGGHGSTGRGSGGRAPVGAPDQHGRFERIYELGYEPILAYALRRAVTPEDAADIVAETFLAAWRRLDDVPDPPEARLWLYATARRVLANQRRGQRRHQRLAGRLRDDWYYRPHDAPAGAVIDGDISAIAAAFGRLRPADREVLALVGWEGLDAEGVARVLECRPGTARVRLHRARRRFARELAAQDIPVPQAGGGSHE